MCVCYSAGNEALDMDLMKSLGYSYCPCLVTVSVCTCVSLCLVTRVSVSGDREFVIQCVNECESLPVVNMLTGRYYALTQMCCVVLCFVSAASKRALVSGRPCNTAENT